MAPLLAIDATGLAGEARAPLSALLAERMLQVIRGPAFEYALTQGLVTDRPSYDQAITDKTSALFELPVEGAALLRTPRDETSDTAVAEAIERFRAGGALAAVLARMQAAAAEVERAPALLRVPGLLELARELVALVLKPIAHVW